MNLNPMQQKSKQPRVIQLLGIVMGKMPAQLVYVAAKLGIADLLKDGPKSVKYLADETNTDPSALYRVLRVLSKMNIFVEKENMHFALTPLAEPLRSDAPDTVKDFAIMCGSEWHDQAWSNLLYSAKTGNPAFNDKYNMDLFDYLKTNPEESDIYNAGMSSLDKLHTRAIASTYDFSKFKSIIDIGGGSGTLLVEILKRNPLLQGILYEQSEVAARARDLIKRENLSDRLQIIEGDFFKSVPGGVDAFILKYVIHDWNDEDCRIILENCRKSMKPDNTLLLIETIISKENMPIIAELSDIEMLIFTPGGKERTEEEFRELLNSAGFKLKRIIPTITHFYILEAQPI